MMTCDYCGEEKEDVERRVNPFNSQLHGDDSEHWMCDDCEQEWHDCI